MTRQDFKLTKSSFQEITKFIEENQKDFEAAHVFEDELMLNFIKLAADKKLNINQAAELAKIILEIDKLDFPRYYA